MDLVAKLSVRVSMSHKRLRMCLNPPTQTFKNDCFLLHQYIFVLYFF